MIKVVCDVCGVEEGASTINMEWRTLLPTALFGTDHGDPTDSTHLCSPTCVARWAQARGATPDRAAMLNAGKIRVSEQVKHANKHQVDLRNLRGKEDKT